MNDLPIEISNIYNKFELNNKKNKEEFGEVFTPFNIVDNMLKKIPCNILIKEDTRWLDTSVGMGHIMVKVYYLIYGHLKFNDKFNDKKQLSKHIIENMLFMTEINKENCDKTREIFKIIDPDSTPNIIECNFLENNDLGEFDIIVMNPPYNSGGTKCKGQKNLYVYFAEKAMNLLKNDGYYLAIHPSTYRINNYKPRGTNIDINELYNKNNVMDITMFTVWQTYQLMDVQINTDIVLIQKNKEYHETMVKNIYGEISCIKINKNNIIPNFGFIIIDKLKKIADRVGSLRNMIYHTSEIHHEAWKKGKIKNGKYKIIHLLKKKENKIYYSDKKHTHQDTPKIIINGLGNKYVFLDREGEYGVTDSPYIILSSSEKIYKLLSSKIFLYVCNALGILGNNLKPFIFDYLPNTDILWKHKENIDNNESLLKTFGLNTKEINNIMSFSNNNVQNLKLKDRKDIFNNI